LDRRAFDRAIGTKDAAIALQRAKQSAAVGALIEMDARVDWHGFDGHEAALWTSECGLQD
jgi:hypothetical protein